MQTGTSNQLRFANNSMIIADTNKAKEALAQEGGDDA